MSMFFSGMCGSSSTMIAVIVVLDSYIFAIAIIYRSHFYIALIIYPVIMFQSDAVHLLFNFTIKRAISFYHSLKTINIQEHFSLL